MNSLRIAKVMENDNPDVMDEGRFLTGNRDSEIRNNVTAEVRSLLLFTPSEQHRGYWHSAGYNVFTSHEGESYLSYSLLYSSNS
jgi:hypothetical protein